MVWTYEDFCANILVLDNAIRFVGIADRKGRIFATARRPGLEPLLTKEEMEESISDAVVRFGIDPSLEKKVGRIIYALTVYEKIRRATIRFYKEDILVITFDSGADHQSIVNDKVLPLLKDGRVIP